MRLLGFILGQLRFRDLGVAGERRARWFYLLRGYRTVARNVRYADGEIDLVVRRGRLVVFVEVKTRQQRERGEGHEAVDRPKQLRIMKLAERWLREARLGDDVIIRFDVLSLFWTGQRFEVQHFADAYRAEFEAGRPWRRI